MRWKLRLTEFDFEIDHRATFKHQAVDAIPRLPTNRLDHTLLEDDKHILAVTREKKKSFNSPTIAAADDSHVEMTSTSGKDTPKLFEFIETERTDTYCNQALQYLALPDSVFSYDEYRILARKAPIDGSIQKVAPTSL